MKMVNMAMKPEKMKEGKSDCCCCSGPCGCGDEEKPRYPWGLQLTLEDEQMKALGIQEMPKTGGEITIQCKVKVTRCSEEEMEGGESCCSMSLQVTEMGMEMPAKEKMSNEEMGKALYTSMKEES